MSLTVLVYERDTCQALPAVALYFARVRVMLAPSRCTAVDDDGRTFHVVLVFTGQAIHVNGGLYLGV